MVNRVILICFAVVFFSCKDSAVGSAILTNYPNCNANGLGGFECRPHLYDWCSVNKTANNYSKRTEYIQYSNNVNTDLYTNFDKMFLKKSVLGYKYSNYYRLLSSYLSNKHTLTNTIETMKLLPEVNKITHILMLDMKKESVRKKYSSTILIDKNVNDKLVRVLDLYKDTYENKDFNGIIEDIKIDLKRISGKKLEEVVSEFE